MPISTRTSLQGSMVLYGGGSTTCTRTAVSQETVARPARASASLAAAAGATAVAAGTCGTCAGPAPSEMFGRVGRGRRTKGPLKPPRLDRGSVETSPCAHLSRALKPTRQYSILSAGAVGQSTIPDVAVVRADHRLRSQLGFFVEPKSMRSVPHSLNSSTHINPRRLPDAVRCPRSESRILSVRLAASKPRTSVHRNRSKAHVDICYDVCEQQVVTS